MIHFSDKQWDNLANNYRKFWKNELFRPILPIVITDAHDAGKKPDYPLFAFGNAHNLEVTPKMIIDRFDRYLQGCEFLGDGYPYMHTYCFGPGTMSLFLGAIPDWNDWTVWFSPKEILPIEDLHFEYDADNFHWKRVQELFYEGTMKWKGEVIISMPDLGGILDILAIFRGTENLLFDLVDSPNEVRRLVKDLQALWFRYFDELIKIIDIYKPRGYSDWSYIFKDKPSYIFQSDFSYMIGNEMFCDFVAEELKSSAARVDKATYHLDGIGQLAHLDTLLKMEEYRTINWFAGAGTPDSLDWTEVYQRIEDAGKKIHLGYNLEFHLEEVSRVLKNPDSIVKNMMFYGADKTVYLKKILSKFNVF